MKANKIYLIKFNDDLDYDDNSEHTVFKEISNVLSKKDMSYVGVSKNDDIFLRLTDNKIEKIATILKKYFTISVDDVSDLVINGSIQKKYPEVEFLTPKLFKNFRIDNTTKDDILDKINYSGINSLDKLDKKILKK